MAQYRQQLTGSGNTPLTNGGGGGGGGGGSSVDHVSVGIRAPNHHKHHHHRHRRSKNSSSSRRRISISTIISLLCFIVAASGFAFFFLSRDHHRHLILRQDVSTSIVQDDDFRSDFLTNVTRLTTPKVHFGHSSFAHGRDSRYWDKDDRRRDEDYNEDVVVQSTDKGNNSGKDRVPSRGRSAVEKSNDKLKKGNNNHHGLYNEAGRDELKMYEEKYEASLKNVGQAAVETEDSHASDDSNLDGDTEEIDVDDEYDDGIDSHDAHNDDYDNAKDGSTKSHSEDGGDSVVKDHHKPETHDDESSSSSHDDTLHRSDKINSKHGHSAASDGQLKTSSKSRPKKHRKRRKFTASNCEMKLLNSTAQLVEPLESRKFVRFSLLYTKKEDRPEGVDLWEPRFAGHQSLREREDSFLARDQSINCGFVKGSKAYSGTGFDLAEDDARYIAKCHIAVVSCIFGNSDRLRSPFTKAVSRLSRKNVCFVMFMDEATLRTVSSEGQMPDRTGFIGLWRVVVVKNLPFEDMRRVGKIPKMLSHRLFPSARYSIWLDSKLRLQSDPLLLLEYFLWRKGYEYAISNHYDRHCVWEEVERNKKLNKFNHTMIDQQFAFYQADGLKRFNGSDPNKLLPSNVPEGSLIIRAHTPMSNLFSCLWFNEVDRFTPRDQLSFAYTYQKLRKKNPNKPFYLHMFKDCERRKIAKLFRHRSEEKRTVGQMAE